MANSRHLKILQQGAEAWNNWRNDNPNIEPDLSSAALQEMDLVRINFRETNLSEAVLWESDLRGANFKLATLEGTQLMGARLGRAKFIRANLDQALLRYADLSGADFAAANLAYATFSDTKLTGASFKEAFLEKTILAGVDLSGVKSLDSVFHIGPSFIDITTLYLSRGNISEKFLRDAGVPEGLISYLPSLIEAVQPFQWHSCFISYSTKNQKFADCLHSRLRQAGLRVWFDREDMKGGDYLHTQIDHAIQLHDRLLLVLSEESIQSKWVEREIKRTRKIERAENRRKLFPIRLVDMKTLREWECLDSDTGEDLAEEVRKYHIPDFSNWKNHDAFEVAFARLEKDLRTSIAG